MESKREKWSGTARMWRRGMFVIVFGLCFFVARVSCLQHLTTMSSGMVPREQEGERGSWVTYVGIA